RISLRPRDARQSRQRGGARGQMQEFAAGEVYFEPPFTSFDHLVSARGQRLPHAETERPGGLEIDRQLELGWRLHWEVGRLLALEDAVDVNRRASMWVNRIGPVGDQATGGDEVPRKVDCGQLVPSR